jgi:predicted transcriptional regulator of viral defense system
MFVEYLEKLRMSGKRSFTFQEIIQDLDISDNGAKSGLYRLKKKNKIISPIKGLYVIVPAEHQPHGCIPAEELIPIMMNHIGAEYYVALLSAAAFYGAAHQKVFKFQIISNRRITHSLEFGQIKIEVIRKKEIANLPMQDFAVNTGYLKVATPEVTAIDLLEYVSRCGGLNHVVTVLSELIESIDVKQLVELADKIDAKYQLQRIGYILENIEVMDEDKKDEIVDGLTQYLKGKMQRYIPLASNISGTGYPRCKKWRIIENSQIESDL